MLRKGGTVRLLRSMPALLRLQKLEPAVEPGGTVCYPNSDEYKD